MEQRYARWKLIKKLDTSKINNLGWYAKTDIDQGIKLTLDQNQKEQSLNG